MKDLPGSGVRKKKFTGWETGGKKTSDEREDPSGDRRRNRPVPLPTGCDAHHGGRFRAPRFKRKEQEGDFKGIHKERRI